MGPPATPTIRRILVALDASPASRFAVATAVSLARRFEAQLMGLFVEDRDLLRVARLPFAREVGPFAFAPRPLAADDLQRQLRAQAERLRRILRLAAETQGIPWEFRVKRGPVAAEVLAAGAEADLVILGRAGRSLMAPQRLGSTARRMLLQRRGLTFVLTVEPPPQAPAIVLYDGSTAGDRALSIVDSLGAAQERRFHLILVAESRAEARGLHAAALDHLVAEPLGEAVRTLVRPTPEGVAWLVRATGPGPVVLPCGRERLQGEPLCRLADAIPNPVLLVR